MRPTLQLIPKHPVRLPEEPTEVTLILGNPGEEPQAIPLPAGNWWQQARLRLSGPDGVLREIALPERAGGSRNTEPTLILSEEAEIAQSFSLEALSPVRDPGEYVLSGTIATSEGDWDLPEARWFADRLQSLEVALPSFPDATERDVLPCWSLLHGEREHVLQVREIVRNDPSNAEGMRISASERLIGVAPEARSLMATAGSARAPAEQKSWVAWLEGRTLVMGVSFHGFHTCRLELPGDPHRILPSLLPRAEGGIDLFVLSEEARQLWAVRIEGPRWLELSPEPSLADAEFDDPGSRVAMAAPELLRVMELPAECRLGAVGRNTGTAEPQKGLALTIQRPTGIEVLFTVVYEDGSKAPWSRVAIERGFLIPQANPALAFDAQGMAHIAVLLRTQQEPDAGEARLTLARLAFGPDGRVQWLEGIGRYDLGVCPASPRGGAVAFCIEEERAQRRCDWCVVDSEGVCRFGQDQRSPILLATSDAIVQPLALVAAQEYDALATVTEDGHLRFSTSPVA